MLRYQPAIRTVFQLPYVQHFLTEHFVSVKREITKQKRIYRKQKHSLFPEACTHNIDLRI